MDHDPDDGLQVAWQPRQQLGDGGDPTGGRADHHDITRDGFLVNYFHNVLGISIALCLVSRYLIELPAMSLRRFVLAKPRPAPGESGLP